MLRFLGVCSAFLVLGAAGVAGLRADEKGDGKVQSVLDFKVENINGQSVDLSKYKGKVVLIVNVASKCGLTPQYKALEELHEKYGKDGLAILGFPANDFLKQEPGSNEEIAKFCTSKYNVQFDMFAKSVVKGKDQSPLYQFLTSKETDPKFAGDITWNFEKFIVGRNGEVVARFNPRIKPDAPQVVQKIEEELNKKQ